MDRVPSFAAASAFKRTSSDLNFLSSNILQKQQQSTTELFHEWPGQNFSSQCKYTCNSLLCTTQVNGVFRRRWLATWEVNSAYLSHAYSPRSPPPPPPKKKTCHAGCLPHRSQDIRPNFPYRHPFISFIAILWIYPKVENFLNSLLNWVHNLAGRICILTRITTQQLPAGLCLVVGKYLIA